MNFVEILKDTGKVLLSIGKFAAPVVRITSPTFGNILNGVVGVIQNNIIDAEEKLPVDAHGPEKKKLVIDSFMVDLNLTQEILAMTGNKVVYDAGKLSEAIDSQVKAYNLFAEFKKTLKVEKL